VTHLGFSLTGCYQYNPCDCGQHAGNCKSTGPFAAELNSQCKDYPGDAPKTSRCSCQPCPAVLSPPQNSSDVDTNCSTMADTLLLLDEHIRHRLKLNFSSFLIDSFWCGASLCLSRACLGSFPYVCPEPVLVKCSFLYTNGSKILIDSFWCGASPPPRAAPQIHLLNFELATS
jgi:hypothetical protein